MYCQNEQEVKTKVKENTEQQCRSVPENAHKVQPRL